MKKYPSSHTHTHIIYAYTRGRVLRLHSNHNYVEKMPPIKIFVNNKNIFSRSNESKKRNEGRRKFDIL